MGEADLNQDPSATSKSYAHSGPMDKALVDEAYDRILEVLFDRTSTVRIASIPARPDRDADLIVGRALSERERMEKGLQDICAAINSPFAAKELGVTGLADLLILARAALTGDPIEHIRAEHTIALDPKASEKFYEMVQKNDRARVEAQFRVLLDDAARSSVVAMAHIDLERAEVREVLAKFFEAGIEYAETLPR